MYLSRAITNKQGTDPQYWHKMVFDFFPNPDANRDFLFRVDNSSETNTALWMFSNREPIKPKWCSDIKCKNIDAKAANVGDSFLFDIVIHPAESKTGKGVVTIPFENIPEWFYKKCKSNGFSISDVAIGDPVIHNVVRPQNKGGRHLIQEVMICGQLIVDDKELFEKAYTQGIGRSRSFGFGMLMLRRG